MPALHLLLQDLNRYKSKHQGELILQVEQNGNFNIQFGKNKETTHPKNQTTTENLLLLSNSYVRF